MCVAHPQGSTSLLRTLLSRQEAVERLFWMDVAVWHPADRVLVQQREPYGLDLGRFAKATRQFGRQFGRICDPLPEKAYQQLDSYARRNVGDAVVRV
jgi:hypothetical protein